MDIKIESSESDRPKSQLQPPPDFMSRGAKIKLLTLVASLMLVLVLMNEARKPDNWKWMGFDEQGKQVKEVEKAQQMVFEEAQYDPIPESDSQRPSAFESDAEKNIQEPTPEVDTLVDGHGSREKSVNQDLVGEVTLAEGKFFQLVYRQLDLDEQRGLFAELRRLRGRSFANEGEFEVPPMVAKMDELVKVRLGEMLNDLSLIDERSPRRTELNLELQRLQKQWEQYLRPALAGEPVEDSTQLRTIHALQVVMDSAAYSLVSDSSAPTWASDDPAWLRTWERILNADEGLVAEQATTPIQLSAEPDFYRGKPVSMTGELRGVEILKTRNNPIGIDQYYSLWIRPQESSIQPFNVYVLELPESLQLNADGFTPFEDIQVDLLGAFFKIRTYEDAGGEISETPLVFAKSIRVSEIDSAAGDLVVRSDWTPSRGLLIAFFIGMPLLAIAIAYTVYRGTRSRKIRVGKAVQSKIEESLQDLGNDPSVQTVQEKLSHLEREGTL